MQIVIDIPEQMYLNAKADTLCGADILVSAIKDGTPLPKGHGDLKDMEDIYEALEGWDDDTSWIVDDIDELPTIIEADDKEEN